MAKSTVPPVNRLAEEFHLVLAPLVRRLRTEGAQHELSWSQLAVMGRLESGGPMTIATLARIETVKPQSMGATVATLEKAGFVARDPHPSDRRQVMFSLTKAGKKIRTDGAEAKRKWLAAMMEKKLNPGERRRLGEAIELLKRLTRTDE